MTRLFPIHLQLDLPRRLPPERLAQRLTDATEWADAVVTDSGYQAGTAILNDLRQDDEILPGLLNGARERSKDWQRVRAVVRSVVQLRGRENTVCVDDVEPLSRIRELQAHVQADHTSVDDGEFRFDGFILSGPGWKRSVFAEAGARWEESLDVANLHFDEANRELELLRSLREQIQIQIAAMAIALFAKRAQTGIPEVLGFVRQQSLSETDRERLLSIVRYVRQRSAAFESEPGAVRTLCESERGFYGSNTVFKKTVGEAIGVSGATVYRVLKAAGVWRNRERGSSGAGLEAMIRSLLDLPPGTIPAG